ncbi:MAG TPA: hypothetical protein V6C78_17655, partial [Crinalium sp.]
FRRVVRAFTVIPGYSGTGERESSILYVILCASSTGDQVAQKRFMAVWNVYGNRRVSYYFGNI